MRKLQFQWKFIPTDNCNVIAFSIAYYVGRTRPYLIGPQKHYSTALRPVQIPNSYNCKITVIY